MPSGHKQLTCTDYHVAWISPLPDVELMPARLMLDEEHPTPRYDTHYDENTYICGTLNGHAVVIATCPKGETGNVNAARLTGIMFKTFPNIRMAVLVGIGGGIPRPIASQNALEDIHLGDVVVGDPGDGKPACVYHDRGKAKVGGVFEMVGTMQSAEWRLTQALGILASDHELGRTNFTSQLERLKSHTKFNRPEYALDRLFKAAYHHTGSHGSGCTECDHAQIVQRRERNELDQRTFVFHQGTIATGNSVIQDGEHRDKIGASCNGALCVEMEAAGVDVYRRCLIIRGISDYADSHKNDVWKFYAAAKAAAFTRELMCKIPPAEVKAMPSVYDPEPRGTRRVSVWKDDGVGRDSPHKSKPASRVRPAVPPKSRSLKAPVTEDAESAKHGTRSSATEDGVQAKNELEKTSESSLDHASEFTMHPSCMVTFPTMRKRHGRANGRVTGCILGHIPVIVHKCGDFLIRKGTRTMHVLNDSGEQASVARIKALFNTPPEWGEGASLDGFTEFDVATVFVDYLNSLSTPLIDEPTTQALGTYCRDRAMDPVLAAAMLPPCISALTGLTRPNIILVLYLLKVLRYFARDNEFNGTTPVSLASQFQGCVLGQPGSDAEQERDREVLSFLIRHYDELLESIVLQNHLAEGVFDEPFPQHPIEW